MKVDSLIRHQFNKESLEQQKPHKAFKTKTLHDGIISEISKYTEKKSCVDSKDKDVQCRYDAIIVRLDRLKEELKNVEEDKVKCEGEMAISRAEEVVELKIERWERTHGDLTSFCAMKDYEEMWIKSGGRVVASRSSARGGDGVDVNSDKRESWG
ncbi:hypothetical protein Tco_0776767 [Tanacetum coccineum]